MMQPEHPSDGSQENPLTEEQRALLKKLQQFFDEGYEEVPQEFIDELNEKLLWDYSDPVSLGRAAYLMARDPYLLREVRAINEDFAALERGEARITGGPPKAD